MGAKDAAVARDGPPVPKRPLWKQWKFWVTLLVATPVLLGSVYTLLTLTWSYSDGQRAGTLQKLSRKGWICKTWEGELMQPVGPGVPPTIWEFSVRDRQAAVQVSGALGHRVILYYKEHRGVPSNCFGETRYFVDSVRVVD